MTVALELAAATHHSSPKGGWPETTHNAPRGQWTASPAGAHPGVLKEPEAQEAAVTVGYVAARAPLLGVPSLAAAAADVADGTTVSVLLRLALKKEDEEERRKVVEMEQKQQKEEDFERRMLTFFHRVRHDLPLIDAELAAWRQWSDKALSSTFSASPGQSHRNLIILVMISGTCRCIRRFLLDREYT